MDNFQIETAQNVSIFQNVAGIGDRLLAFLIDFLILAAYYIFIFIIFSNVDIDSLDPRDLWTYSLIIGLPPFLYHLFFETFWDGRTPGKAVVKLRVVKLDGSKPGFGSFLIRWMMRTIDILIATGGIAVISILLSEKGQRLGDRAARTTVISEKKRVNLSQSLLEIIPDDYVPTYPQVTVFTDQDVQTIKTVFTDAKRNSNHNVIIMLSQRLKDKMNVDPDETNIEFVDRVIKDYNYYTQQ
ncbi:RDD family protein [uncultured Dokdonia sp.]|uniref:RDD family protein n=1 Tax=uncultured Dokdonia sp. TaxID=575653 RepID=UPI0026161DF0|nr:RDD family protein [uncultured Dokdonia sp.]